ncbi:MAG: hypothetical protein ACXIUB_11400 [Wenzhouxiangella sp.]
MTIVIVLLGLLISHFFFRIKRFRDFRWLTGLIGRLRTRWPEQDWLALIAVLLLALLLAGLGGALMSLWLGLAGWFLFSLLVLLYTLGPRDLDRDVEALRAQNGAETDPALVRRARRSMRIDADTGGTEAGAAVLHAALSRWFGILFWFVVLGPLGALLYRFNRAALQIDDLREGELEWLVRLRLVMDWPVLLLTVLAAGLCGDLDRVNQARKRYAQVQPGFWLWPSLLDKTAEAFVPEDADQRQGLLLGHQMVWRMLMLWLVVMSLMLLAGWLV